MSEFLRCIRDLLSLDRWNLELVVSSDSVFQFAGLISLHFT